jgi:hypothetical protein
MRMTSRLRIIVASVAVASSLLVWSPVAHASFGLQSFDFSVDSAPPAGAEPGAVGPPDVQAGSHPFQVSIGFAFKTTESQGAKIPDGSVKDLQVELPTGFVGNADSVPQCPQETFEQSFLFTQDCPADTQIGILTLDTTLAEITVPLFNLTPPPGVPARFGVFALITPVIMDVSVRTGGDYGLTVNLLNLSQLLPVLGGTVVLWGVPADKRHDALRGNCLESGGGSSGECPSNSPVKPFLTLPGSCGGSPEATVSVDSWENPGVPVQGEAVPRNEEGNALSLTGCERLNFNPTLEVQSESTTADTPSGFAVDVRMPQNEDPYGLAEADLRHAVVTLPPGVSLNPAAADGLGACSSQQIGLDNAAQPDCPDASRIGSVDIESPLLARALQGAIYLATPNENTFGSLLAVYMAAEQDGVLLKLAGRIDANPGTGQLTFTIDDTPQLPFTDLTLTFEGGPRAPLATPPGCGTFTTTSQLTPYSVPQAAAPATPSSSFNVDEGCGGGFSPSFLAGATSVLAGHDTGFTLQIARADGEQLIQSLSATLPPGLLARLSGVPLCMEVQAVAGTCAAASEIGSIVIAAGAGSDPFHFEGQVFLTGPYGGAPFSLSIVVPGVAGPLELGTIVVRAKVFVDLQDAHMTITTDSLPSILEGVPLRIRGVNLTIDRPGFMLNPTSCERQRVSATVIGATGAEALLSSPFAVAGCVSLPFSPSLAASTTGLVTQAGGAALALKIRNPQGTQANIRAISVVFPEQFSPRLTTIQVACTQATFATNPASCPLTSVVGLATVRTPILGVALSGPAYLVSGGRATLPRLALVLQGQGLTLQIVGSLNVASGHPVTATFASMPDAPISSFALNMARQANSALGANFLTKASGSLCGRNLQMPIMIVAQSGARVDRTTKVSVAGCPKHRAAVRSGDLRDRSRHRSRQGEPLAG